MDLLLRCKDFQHPNGSQPQQDGDKTLSRASSNSTLCIDLEVARAENHVGALARSHSDLVAA